MSQEIRAIYENGLFRPLDPVALTDHDEVSLVIVLPTVTASSADDAIRALRQRLLCEALDEANRMPLESADDGFSGVDHDLVLYGWKK